MIQRVERKLRSWVARFRTWRYRRQGRELIHFLHIGKTGGTAVKHALRDVAVSKERIILLHQHHVHLRDIPEGEKVFFFLRDPVERFVSGFMSRQRMGHPHYHVPWKQGEKQAFGWFSTPEELALGLEAEDAELRGRARMAISQIGHVRSTYWDWFESVEYLRTRKPDILFIGHLESLVQDFEHLAKRLELSGHICLPVEPDRANRNPAKCDAALSSGAHATLKTWYKEEYCFLSVIRRMFPEFHETE